jgi:hypothetical protein
VAWVSPTEVGCVVGAEGVGLGEGWAQAWPGEEPRLHPQRMVREVWEWEAVWEELVSFRWAPRCQLGDGSGQGADHVLLQTQGFLGPSFSNWCPKALGWGVHAGGIYFFF